MRLILTTVAGLFALMAIGFPINPSFTSEAVKEYKAKADVGAPEAQYLYSCALANGRGIQKDLPQVFIYAKKAVDQGYNRALRGVGLGYQDGWGVESNAVNAAACYVQFVAWARPAANQGDADAQFQLGVCLQCGDGVGKDEVEAVRWYRKAAEQRTGD